MLEIFKQAIAKSPLIYWCLSTSCDGSVWKEAGWEGAFTALCWPFVEIASKSTPRQFRMKTSSLSRCSARTQVVFSPNGHNAVICCLYRRKCFLPSTLGHGSVIWIRDNEGYFFFFFPHIPSVRLGFTAIILCKYVTMWRHKGDWAIRCRKAIFSYFIKHQLHIWDLSTVDICANFQI